jgi:malate dehydrogenase (oxaloacetate-decarboxylating)(NADP+)
MFPLEDPLRNKGTAFTQEERARLGLEGLLPPRVESIDEQVVRVMTRLRAQHGALERYLALAALREDNTTLFYRVLVEHLEELLPIVYTPTVGEACLAWSRLDVPARGLYITARHRGRVAQLLRNWPQRGVRIIVVTDGSRILGLGDLGANGMGIPLGKLALYSACGGVPPALGLPVTLDLGTANAAVRDDPYYLGERSARLEGEERDALLDEFIAATQEVFPGAIVQFEDFSNATAFALLGRYRDRLCCFNDDIQGTGAMGLAGLYAAARATGTPLSAQRLLFAGAGEACLGIGTLVVAAMRREGLSEKEARQRCLFIDSRGAVVESRIDLPAHKRRCAQAIVALADLPAAVAFFRPTALIGASAQSGLFTRPVLEAMARASAHPVVFALSNPTSKAECTAEQAYAWSGGHALFAAGSPFAPVRREGRLLTPGQANNAWIFPGLGLGLLLSRAARVTDDMFIAAARALAAHVTEEDLAQGRLFPAAARMREVAASVAAAVAGVPREEARAAMYRPEYAG